MQQQGVMSTVREIYQTLTSPCLSTDQVGELVTKVAGLTGVQQEDKALLRDAAQFVHIQAGRQADEIAKDLFTNLFDKLTEVTQ